MKKVLIFGLSSTVGGVENFIINLYENIDKSKFQLDFLVTECLEGPYREKVINEYGANVHIIPSLKKHPINCIKKIKEIALKEDYDMVHINLCSSQLFIYIWLLKRFSKKNIKIITHSHSSSDSNVIRRILHYIIKPILIKNTDKYIACSNIAGKWMFGNKVLKSKKIIVIKNAIFVDKFLYDKRKRLEFRKENSYKENDFIIGHIGRFEEVKNHKFMIEIFNNYHKINKNAKLLLVGDGSLKVEIKNLVKELRLEKFVKIFDVSSSVDVIYQGIDMFILPSLFEGLPTVGIEAQTAGLKCVFSTNVTSESNITGNVKFLPLNENIWIDYIDSIYKNNYDRENMKKLIIKSGYDLSSEIKKIEKLYEE